MSDKQLKDYNGNVYLNPNYKIVTKTGEAKFTGSDYAVVSIDLTETGWTPVALAGFRGGANTITYRVNRVEISGNTLTATVVNKNTTSETSTQTATFRILYLRTL